MLEFLRPIVAIDTWLYIALGLLALFFLRAMWIARHDRARSIFTLERENATNRMTRYFTGFMITLGLMLGVYYLSLITPRIVPPPPETPTPTPILVLPDTPTPPPLLPTPTITPTPLPGEATVEIPPLTGIEITSTPPPPPPPQVAPPNCPNPGSRITQPGNGARVAGVIQITGAAFVDNFEYYKFEFRPAGGGDWSFITRYDNSVAGGVLGSWNTDTVPPGTYELRLVVVDFTGNFPEPCVTQVIVQ